MAPPTNQELNTDAYSQRGRLPQVSRRKHRNSAPKALACFEDDGAAYLVTEYVEGVGINNLDGVEGQRVVSTELEGHMQAMKKLTSDVSLPLCTARICTHWQSKSRLWWDDYLIVVAVV
jgi:hypothetical protein